jgi:hypothetical protein
MPAALVLVAVSATTEETGSLIPHNVLDIIRSIVEHGNIEGKALAAQYGDVPVIDGSHQKMSTDRYKDAAKMGEVLKETINAGNAFHFRSHQGNRQADRSAALELVNHLQDPCYLGQGAVFELGSSRHTFNKFFDNVAAINAVILNRPSSPTVDVYPCGLIDDVSGTRIASWTRNHLIAGTKYWLVYPPTAHNLSRYRTHCYDSSDYKEVCKQFQGGIGMLQRAGQTIYISPFWPYICFTMLTATSISNRYILLQDYPRHLQHLDTLRAVSYLSIGDEQSKLSQEDVRAILDDVCLILRNDHPNLDVVTTPQALGIAKQWLEVNHALRQWIEDVDDEQWRNKAMHDLVYAWLTFAWDEDNYVCPICGREFENYVGSAQ